MATHRTTEHRSRWETPDTCVSTPVYITHSHVSRLVYIIKTLRPVYSTQTHVLSTVYTQGWLSANTKAVFTPGHMSPGNMRPRRATWIQIHTCQRTHVARYKLLVPDTCWLYLGDITAIHLCHGRLVSLCIQQQTGNKLATILSPIQETCWRRQVDTTCIRHNVSWCKRGVKLLKPGFHPNAIACVACVASVACVAFGWKPG